MLGRRFSPLPSSFRPSLQWSRSRFFGCGAGAIAHCIPGSNVFLRYPRCLTPLLVDCSRRRASRLGENIRPVGPRASPTAFPAPQPRMRVGWRPWSSRRSSIQWFEPSYAALRVASESLLNGVQLATDRVRKLSSSPEPADQVGARSVNGAGS